MHTQNSGRFVVDEDFLQFRTAPKMMMDRKRNWAENETDLRTKIPKTKLVRNWKICSFGAENENEIRSVSTPSPGPGEYKSFKQLVNRAGQIPWNRADFRWETIPKRGSHNREGPMLFNGCASMRHHKITFGGRAKRLSAI